MKRAAVARLVIRANVANIGGVATRLGAIKYIDYLGYIEFSIYADRSKYLKYLKIELGHAKPRIS